MSSAVAEIFRSPRRADCEERALVLVAVGIASTVAFDGAHFILEVDAAAAAAAAEQLLLYETETRPAPEPPPPMSVQPHAWLGCALYALVLILVALLSANGFWRLDAFDTGELDAARVRAGQWWRAWTALTLHVDGAHLAGNLAGGMWFGYLAARQIGTGLSWLLIVVGAGVANLLDAYLGPAANHSVGASTAVFTALGLLAAHSWRMRLRLPQRWASRWGPLVGGVALLTWTGAGGEQTDVAAHLAGFVVGTLTGAGVAEESISSCCKRLPQQFAGLSALTVILLAWVAALAS